MLRRGCEMSLLPTILAHDSRDLSPVLGLSAWRIALVVLPVSRAVRLLVLGSYVGPTLSGCFRRLARWSVGVGACVGVWCVCGAGASAVAYVCCACVLGVGPDRL